MNPPLAIAPGAWTVFVPYTPLHALVLAVCAALIAAPALIGRGLGKGSGKNAERALRKTLAALAVGYWLAYMILWNRHGLDPRTGLPLQLCDLNGLVAPYALVTRQRWARATLYFWTAALTTQAFIQPALTLGPASPIFWAFWTAHTLIAICAVYDVVVRGFRPRWRDLGYAVLASAVYVAAVMPIDIMLGANYGFVGNPQDLSEIPPFVTALGPWPQRAIILAALVPLGFVIVLLPWLIAGWGAALGEPGRRSDRTPGKR